MFRISCCKSKQKNRDFQIFLRYLYTRGTKGPSGRGRALLLHDGFQLARGGGKVLDVELVVLRARPGPVTSSNKLRHPVPGPHLPAGSPELKSEFRRSARGGRKSYAWLFRRASAIFSFSREPLVLRRMWRRPMAVRMESLIRSRLP